MKNLSKKYSNHKSPFYRESIDIDEFKQCLNSNINHGLCGSINLGNTCFMNSSIACLSNCTELTAYFLLKQFVNDINRYNYDGAKGRLAEEWYKLLYHYWNTHNRVGRPENIKNIVGSKSRKFLGYNQQDSNEFMTVFLEILGEDLNRTTKKKYIELKEQQEGESDVEAAKRFWNLHVQRNDSIVTDLFHGLLKSTITCPKCHFKNITYDPFNTLALTIPDSYKINQFQKKKRKKSIKTSIIKKEKEKEVVNIYYVPSFSIKQTKKIEIEVYKGLSLKEILKEIEKRSSISKISDSKFFYVENRVIVNELDKKSTIRNESFIFGYEKKDKKKNYLSLPIYLHMNKRFSAYPRLLFLNENETFYDFKTKIYCILRKYLKNPFHNPNTKEQFEVDKLLEKYIEGQSNNLEKVITFINEEFSLLHKNNLLSNLPYKICILPDLKNDIPKENINNFNQIQEFEIFSENDSINKMIKFINQNNYYLVVHINSNSHFTKNNISLDCCIVEKSSPLNEEEQYKECKMEVEEEDEDEENHYSNGNYITLDHCLQYFTEEECLDQGNEWHCSNCRKRVMALKQIELFYLPKIMCICLTRFLKKGRFNDYTKNNDFVEFPLEDLNMGKYICGPDKKYSKYDLFAVSQHYGGMGGGHYTAVCKNIDGNWYEYDDSSCNITSSSNVCTNAAYVLFYRRKNW